MKHKIILITAGAAILAGTMLAAAGTALGGASDGDISYRSQTISEKIAVMNIVTDFNDVIVIPSDRDDIHIRYVTASYRQYNIHAENGVLSINSKKESGMRRKWYDYIHFDFRKKQDLIVEVPRGFEANMCIENNYGSVKVSDIKGSLSAKLDCGDIDISGCEFQAFACENDYGDIKISHIIAEEIKLNNNCGDIELEEVQGNIDAHCDLGDIEFGYIAGDRLHFTVDCGDIEGIIRGRKTDYEPNGTKKLETKTKLGDVDIKFTES